MSGRLPEGRGKMITEGIIERALELYRDQVRPTYFGLPVALRFADGRTGYFDFEGSEEGWMLELYPDEKAFRSYLRFDEALDEGREFLPDLESDLRERAVLCFGPEEALTAQELELCREVEKKSSEPLPEDEPYPVLRFRQPYVLGQEVTDERLLRHVEEALAAVRWLRQASTQRWLHGVSSELLRDDVLLRLTFAGEELPERERYTADIIRRPRAGHVTWPEPQVRDKKGIARLRKLVREGHWEAWLQTEYPEDSFAGLDLPVVEMIHGTQEVVFLELFDDDSGRELGEEEISVQDFLHHPEELLDRLTEAFLDLGTCPRELLVADDRTQAVLRNWAKAAGTKLTRVEELPGLLPQDEDDDEDRWLYPDEDEDFDEDFDGDVEESDFARAQGLSEEDWVELQDLRGCLHLAREQKSRPEERRTILPMMRRDFGEECEELLGELESLSAEEISGLSALDLARTELLYELDLLDSETQEKVLQAGVLRKERGGDEILGGSLGSGIIDMNSEGESWSVEEMIEQARREGELPWSEEEFAAALKRAGEDEDAYGEYELDDGYGEDDDDTVYLDGPSCLIRVALKDAVRDIHLSTGLTLQEFGLVILRAFDFEERTHEHAFIFGEEFGEEGSEKYMDPQTLEEEGEDLWGMPGTDETTVGEVLLEEGEEFTFLYDFDRHWTFHCTALNSLGERMKGAKVVRRQGKAPRQR